MKCPRCGSDLREILPGPKWLRHFVCGDCDSAWRLESRRDLVSEGKVRYWRYDVSLARGRTPRIPMTVEDLPTFEDETSRPDPIRDEIFDHNRKVRRTC